jgi:hypothetical protein
MSDKKEIKKDFDREAFKKAIAHVESSGGKFLENRTSSAAGRYHFLYRYIQDIPLLRGVTKREFINRPELQEQVMDMAIDGTLPGFPSYKEYAKELQSKYKTDLGLHDIAALTHFLGKSGARKYLSNPNGFVVPGKNASVSQYINKFRKAFGPGSTIADKNIAKNSPDELGLNTKAQDNTAVAPKVIKEQKFDFQDSGKDYIDYLNNGELYDKAPVEAEGTVKALENTDESMTEAPTQTEPQVGEGTVLREPTNPPPVSAELEGMPMDENLSFLNTLAMGGFLNQHGAQDIIPIENGGTHEENPYGGVPMGIGVNGKMNTVEEGEVKFGDYVFSNRLSLGGEITQLGTKENTFADGGDLTDPKKKESRKNSNPVTDPVFGPIPAEKDLEFTKSEYQTTPYGGLKKVEETFQVPNVREDYMVDNYVTTQKSDNVNFNLAINDKNALEFLNRYNNPWSRQKLAEQAGLSPEDIDNMILKGLNVKKEIGGQGDENKGIYDASKNKINIGIDYDGKPGVETHERVHASLFDAAQGENLMKILGNPFQQETRSFMKKSDPETVRYLKKPHEAYGNFVEFREKLGLKPGEQIDEKELNKRIKAKGLDNENFIRVFDDSKVVKALNTIAKVDTKPTMDEYRIA